MRKTVLEQSLVGIVAVFLFTLVACQPPRKIEEEGAELTKVLSAESGDIIVSNGGSRAVLLLDKDGLYKQTIFTANVGETVWGITWMPETEEVAIAVDGVDRVIAVRIADLARRNLFISSGLSGNLRELMQLNSGDFLIIETSLVERFSIEGTRITNGGWPKALQTLPQGMSPMAFGGFLMCSRSTDVVRTYTETGVQVATASSGVAATTDGAGCAELSNGNIAVVWSGTTDTLQIRNPSLTTVLASFSNTSVLGAPSGLAQASDGNILIPDTNNHYIVEVDQNGDFVRIVGAGILNAPRTLVVVP